MKFQPLRMWIVSVAGVIALGAIFAAGVQAQEPFVLKRDLTRVAGVSVIRLNPYGVELDNGVVWPIEDLLDGTMPTSIAEEWNQLKPLATLRFRIKQRLDVGDRVGAGEVASDCFDTDFRWLLTSGARLISNEPANGGGGQSGKAIAAGDRIAIDQVMLVSVLTMEHSLRVGQRQRAVIAFLAAASCARATRAQPWQRGAGRPVDFENSVDFENAFSPLIQPVWFDIKRLATTRQQIESFLSAGLLVSPKQSDPLKSGSKQDRQGVLGVELYLASIELSTDRLAEARQRLAALPTIVDQEDISIALKQLRGYLEMKESGWQRESRGLANAHPLSIFLRNRIDRKGARVTNEGTFSAVAGDELEKKDLVLLSDSDQIGKVLELLSIPANYSTEFPYLSAAAIDRVARYAEELGDREAAKKLKDELSRTYGHTYHARRINQ